MKGHDDRAKAVLTKLRGHSNVEHELDAIKETAHHSHGSFKLLFSKRLRILVVICLGLFMFQQLSGINTIMYYAPTIYKHAGFVGAHGQILASVCDGVVFIVATVVGIWTVDSIGRRALFFIGFIGMILCLTLLGHAYGTTGSNALRYIALSTVLGYIFFFGISLGPLSYLIMSELFPLNVRSTGMALASCSNWAFNFIVSSTFLTLISWLGIGHTFYLYALLTFLGLVFTYFLVPETKGMTLEQIEDNLYKGQGLERIDMGNPVAPITGSKSL